MVGDITEVQCLDGKLYTAAILDCFNGEAVGLVMDDNMRKELCIRALENACRIQGARNIIFHSDRGNQYTSTAYRACLAKYGASQSMSSTGRCYDYARMESFWALESKGELLITIMSSLGQRESRSISKNCIRSQRKRFADEKVTVSFDHFLCYGRGRMATLS